jgi:hypothetical protein
MMTANVKLTGCGPEKAHRRAAFWRVRVERRVRQTTSKQGLELFNGKTSIFHDATHGKRLDWIMARDGYQTFPLLMTMCLPCLIIRKPAFSRARTASKWLIPGSVMVNKNRTLS